MFTKRTIRPHEVVTSVDTPVEALALSIGERGKVDMAYMSQLCGLSEEEIYRELKGVIFLNPMYGYGGSREEKYLPADEYLSGNVREKLEWARRSAQLHPEDYTANVEALEKAQPNDLDASEIDVRLGATWIDKGYIQQFMEETFDPPYYLRRDIRVNFSEYTAEWNITGKSAVGYGNINANMTYGTERANAYKILEETLNLRDIRIYDTKVDADGKEKRVLNSKETTLAQQKQQAIKDAFQEWVWKDPDRREALVRKYNDLFNSSRPREYDGQHIIFSGMNPEIRLREHQLNAVAHILWDERFSRNNRAWAQTVPMEASFGSRENDHSVYYVVDKAHSGLTDLFVSHFRREQAKEREQPKKESILGKLQKPLPGPAAKPGKDKNHER